MYNKDNLIPTNDTYMLYASCENINGLSKLHFNDNKNYLIYSCFKNCSDKNYENDTYCINQKEKEKEEEKEKEKEEVEVEEKEKEEEEKEKEEGKEETEEENKEKEEEKEKETEKENKGKVEENKWRDEEKKLKNIILILVIIISVIIIIFLIGLAVICKECLKNNRKNNNKFERDWKKGKEDEKLIKDIMTDLIPNNQE